MPSITVNSSWAKYRPRTGARWDGPYQDTVMAGNNASGGVYRALWYFPVGSLNRNNINSMTLYLYRTGTTTNAKTLNIYVASGYNSDGTANAATTVGTYSFSAGAGWKTFGLSRDAINSLKSYGYIYVHNDWTNNTYTEFSPTAQVAIDYTDAVAPSAPTWVSVSPTIVEPGKTTVTVSWGGASTSSGSITGYNVDYGWAGGNWTRLQSGLNGTSLTDTWSTGWARGTNIGYRVQTVNSYGLTSGVTTNWDAYINAKPNTLTGFKYNGREYADGACYSESPVVFSWGGTSVPAHGSGLHHYEVQLGVWNGSGYTFGSPISTGTTRSYSWDLTQFPRGQRLWMNVRLVDVLGAAGDWAGTPHAIYYNRLPTACVVDYPVAGATVYSSNPRICVTGGSDPDGKSVTLAGVAGGVRADSNSGAWSRSGTYTGGSKAVLRWPNAVAGNVAIGVLANDGAADGPSTSASFMVSTAAWGEPVLRGNTPVKAAHINELRQAVNNMRAAYGLDAATWTDSTLTPGTTSVKAVHIVELRAALEAVRDKINGFDPSAKNNLIPAFAWSPGAERGKPILAAHITEIRRAIEQI